MPAKLLHNASGFWYWADSAGYVWKSRADLEALRDHIWADPTAWECDRQLAALIDSKLEEASAHV